MGLESATTSGLVDARLLTASLGAQDIDRHIALRYSDVSPTELETQTLAQVVH